MNRCVTAPVSVNSLAVLSSFDRLDLQYVVKNFRKQTFLQRMTLFVYSGGTAGKLDIF